MPSYEFPALPAHIAVLLVVAAAWSMVWKGIALWKASRNGNLTWFVVMFLVNTLGILEIIYIFFVGQRKIQPSPLK